MIKYALELKEGWDAQNTKMCTIWLFYSKEIYFLALSFFNRDK